MTYFSMQYAVTSLFTWLHNFLLHTFSLQISFRSSVFLLASTESQISTQPQLYISFPYSLTMQHLTQFLDTAPLCSSSSYTQLSFSHSFTNSYLFCIFLHSLLSHSHSFILSYFLHSSSSRHSLSHSSLLVTLLLLSAASTFSQLSSGKLEVVLQGTT